MDATLGRPTDFQGVGPSCNQLIQVHRLFLQTLADLVRAPPSLETQARTARDSTLQPPSANVGFTISLFNALFPIDLTSKACWRNRAGPEPLRACPPCPFTIVSRRHRRRDSTLSTPRFGPTDVSTNTFEALGETAELDPFEVLSEAFTVATAAAVTGPVAAQTMVGELQKEKEKEKEPTKAADPGEELYSLQAGGVLLIGTQAAAAGSCRMTSAPSSTTSSSPLSRATSEEKREVDFTMQDPKLVARDIAATATS
jgi:hypothetical protein